MKVPIGRVSWPGPAGGRGPGDDAVRRGLDRAAAGLNRIIWYSIHKGASPYPGRPGEQPGQAVDLD